LQVSKKLNSVGFRHSCESRNPDVVFAKAGNNKGIGFPFLRETLDSASSAE